MVYEDRGCEDRTKIYSERSKLESLAYRFLGTMPDAEDAVQETYLRWYKLTQTERQQIVSPIAWQRTTLTRICLDKLKSARSKREVYIGEWLPEPVSHNDWWESVSEINDPVDHLISAHSVSMALMIVLDKMTPAERVSFILHDVFQYSFEEISEIVDRTPQACRQLASSGRKRIKQECNITSSPEEHKRVNNAFRAAWITGNIKELVAVLDERASAVTDGGGIVSAAIEPLFGRDAIVNFFLSAFERQHDLQIEEGMVNGEPGLIGKVAGRTITVISTHVREGKINEIWVMRNPEKLTDWH
ncbi:sigma-70 family RNA polymerase sigma factor [Xenorhabdus sp. 12]|uniref:Sigma-70 family RNA polymerase sigma factor n=1 Tax=Xenorhabdus santafensis TaxID=2582833 RepID=A0ABU4S437_9GAMM|nr:RNA polymerase sigma factor SigJ [Xenorhabdus sp. 12]MDX7985862.1 sigma-70 family RNA polymerase sigma factor [Xenorhabdus sp. 12]